VRHGRRGAQPVETAHGGPVEVEVPTFHVFSEEWWLRNEKRFATKTRTDYRWRLEAHLLPYFAELCLDAITFDTVERYIAAKLAEDKPLSPRSINMTVILLGAILEGAVERELIARNPTKRKGRRVRERAPSRSYLETAEQIAALLDAAGEWTARPQRSAVTSSDARCSPRSRSRGCGSASCARCAGATWTSPPGGCTPALRQRRATGS
jgi:hypothetical protein